MFTVFSNVDPTIEVLLSDWINKMPESYAAVLSRGIYYYSVAYAHRGGKFMSETRKKQEVAMQKYIVKSKKDILKAITLSPRATLAYSYLIRIGFTNDSRNNTNKALKEGLAINPGSYYIRMAYLRSLEPKWGGSFRKISAFLNDTKIYIGDHPRLKLLLGYRDYTAADIFKLNGEREKADIYYSKSLKYGENSSFLYNRGINSYILKRYDAALVDFNRVLMIWPQFTGTLLWRSKLYKKRKMYDEALADLDLALELDPYNNKVLKNRAYLYNKLNKIHKANQDFTKSTFYNPYNAAVWHSIGWYNHYKAQEYDKASVAFEKAVTLKPDKIKYWYAYSVTLNILHDCKVVNSLEQFLKLCEDSSNKECVNNKTSWAKNTLTQLAQRKICY